MSSAESGKTGWNRGETPMVFGIRRVGVQSVVQEIALAWGHDYRFARLDALPGDVESRYDLRSIAKIRKSAVNRSAGSNRLRYPPQLPQYAVVAAH